MLMAVIAASSQQASGSRPTFWRPVGRRRPAAARAGSAGTGTTRTRAGSADRPPARGGGRRARRGAAGRTPRSAGADVGFGQRAVAAGYRARRTRPPGSQVSSIVPAAAEHPGAEQLVGATVRADGEQGGADDGAAAEPHSSGRAGQAAGEPGEAGPGERPHRPTTAPRTRRARCRRSAVRSAGGLGRPVRVQPERVDGYRAVAEQGGGVPAEVLATGKNLAGRTSLRGPRRACRARSRLVYRYTSTV